MVMKLHLSRTEVAKMTNRASSAAVAVLLLASSLAPAAFGQKKSPEGRIQKEVRHELLSLGRYGVFDNIEYTVNGTEVTLLGQVTEPVLKDDAGKAVKEIEGVTNVNNKIEVLPVSPMDWNVRRAVFRAIYADPGLSRYSFQAVPSIHIIVKNGNVTLVGAVGTEMDKEVAGVRANSVPGIFAVKNELRVDSGI